MLYLTVHLTIDSIMYLLLDPLQSSTDTIQVQVVLTSSSFMKEVEVAYTVNSE